MGPNRWLIHCLVPCLPDKHPGLGQDILGVNTIDRLKAINLIETIAY